MRFAQVWYTNNCSLGFEFIIQKKFALRVSLVLKNMFSARRVQYTKKVSPRFAQVNNGFFVKVDIQLVELSKSKEYNSFPIRANRNQ